MPLYINKKDIEEPKIVGKTIRLSSGMYPRDVMTKLEKFTGDNYATTLINRSRYTVIGSGAGLLVGLGLSMFLKRGKWGGAILGAMAGAAIGYGYTKLVEKISSKNATVPTTIKKR